MFSWIISNFGETGRRKRAEKRKRINKTICKKWNFRKHQFESSYQTKYQLKCHKWDFRHKRWNWKKLFNHTYWLAQIESLSQNHHEPYSDSIWALMKVYLKSYFLFTFFSFFLSDLNLLFFIKHYLEEIREGIIKD